MLTILVCNEVHICYTWTDAMPSKFQKLSGYQVSESYYNTKKKMLVPMNWVGPSVITKICHARLQVYKSDGTLPCLDDKRKSTMMDHISNLNILYSIYSIFYSFSIDPYRAQSKDVEIVIVK
jgi:hypothetical protein